MWVGVCAIDAFAGTSVVTLMGVSVVGKSVDTSVEGTGIGICTSVNSALVGASVESTCIGVCTSVINVSVATSVEDPRIAISTSPIGAIVGTSVKGARGGICKLVTDVLAGASRSRTHESTLTFTPVDGTLVEALACPEHFFALFAMRHFSMTCLRVKFVMTRESDIGSFVMGDVPFRCSQSTIAFRSYVCPSTLNDTHTDIYIDIVQFTV